MSILDPLSCGFAKVFVYELLIKDCHGLGKIEHSVISEIYREHLNQYLSHFSTGKSFDVSYDQYKKNFVKIRGTIFNLGKASPEKKSILLDTFSSKEWNELKVNDRSNHSLENCKACLSHEKFRIPLASLPVKKKALKRKAVEAGLYAPKRKVILAATAITVNNLNKEYKKEHSVSFEKAVRLYTNISDKSRQDSILKKAKNDVENQLAETSVQRLFGTTQSKSQHQKQRIAQSIGSSDSAAECTVINKARIESGLKVAKNHVGNFSSYSWDSAGCLTKVNSFPDDYAINFSQLAEEFNLLNAKGETPKNGGQIVKEYLQKSGCDVGRFKQHCSQPSWIRKMKRRNLAKKLYSFDGVKELIIKDEIDSLRFVSRQRPDIIQMKDGLKETLIHIAAWEDKEDALKILLQISNEYVNIRNQNGEAALLLASNNGHKECVKMLLEHNADVNIKNRNGSTALMAASHNDHKECVKMLLEHNADVNIENNGGNTAYSIARNNDIKTIISKYRH